MDIKKITLTLLVTEKYPESLMRRDKELFEIRYSLTPLFIPFTKRERLGKNESTERISLRFPNPSLKNLGNNQLLYFFDRVG